MLSTSRNRSAIKEAGQVCCFRPMSTGKPTVLLVEDDHYVAAVLWTMLRQADFDVVTTTSGAEGLQLARTLRPDVVILDMYLPEMNGLEVCQQIKSDPEICAMPVVFFSGHGDMAEQALELGARAFLVKPDDIARLVAYLRQILHIQPVKKEHAA